MNVLSKLMELLEEEDNEEKCKPKSYIKSEFQPSQASADFETKIKSFADSLTSALRNIHQNTTSSANIPTTQEHLLGLLRNNSDFIVIDTDKNLGPTIMERKKYA